MSSLRFLLLFVAFTSFYLSANAQSVIVSDEVKINDVMFKNVQQVDYSNKITSNDFLYHNTISVSQNIDINNFRVINLVTEPVSSEVSSALKLSSIPLAFQPEIHIALYRKNPFALVSFIPFLRSENGSILKITSYQLEISGQPVFESFQKSAQFATQSVLESGEWFKVRLNHDGVYKIDRQFLTDLGVDMNNFNPNQLNIYGHPGGMLPINNNADLPGDPQKLAIEFVGNQDNTMGDTEYFIFYGEGPDNWTYSENGDQWTHLKNYYSNYSYFFIKTNDINPKRVFQETDFPSPPTQTINDYVDFKFHEVNSENLIKSGRNFFGEKYDTKLEYEFNFAFTNLNSSKKIKIRTAAAARNHGSSSNSSFTVTPSGGDPNSFSLPPANGDYAFASYRINSFEYVPDQNFSTLNIKIRYNQVNPTNLGWLDYVEATVYRSLIYNGSQMKFREDDNIGDNEVAEYLLSNATNDLKIWDVSDYKNAFKVPYSLSGTQLRFVRPHSSIETYIAFRNGDVDIPEAVGRINNQNIHGANNVDMVIVTYPDFMPAAQKIAQIHEEEGLSIFITTQDLIFNEFACGKKDPTAIKHFMKALYDNADNENEIPRYLLLLGDASYDIRPESTSNYIYTYESANSWHLLQSFLTDDYFGLLDDNESDRSQDIMDIAVGRFPVTELSQANDMINKMEKYKEKHTVNPNPSVQDFNQTPYGDWRNIITFVADDEDNNVHMFHAESLSNRIRNEHPTFNLENIYLDAFQQESTPGGKRYPEVEKRLNDRVQKGALIINYIGHGGEVGWAHERILDVNTIVNWTNINNLTLFYTATCEFARFDDPARVSAGEECVLNPNGGSVAILSTTRLVFSAQNFTLTNRFYDHVFNSTDDPDYRLGDVVMLTKQASAGPSNNYRNFSLLGDPALKLSYPLMNVNTTEINDIPANDPLVVIDTLNALSKVKISGIVDFQGQDPNTFNGEIYPTVFGKEKTLTTLGNDNNPDQNTFQYKVRNTVLFKGKASMVNGHFSFEFIVPKDIPLQYGIGKLSYYMVKDNSFIDGSGYSFNYSVGGVNTDAPEDNQGPAIEAFLNDISFVSGSITNQNPILLANLRDDFGINTAGSGIGHDITAVIDGKVEDKIILNEFYESDIDTYKSGKLKYQMQNLSEGKHTIEIKAWDVYNNSATTTLEFEVKNEAEITIDHVLNYPNPFTTYTEFWFEHNQALSSLDVQVQVYTVSGRLVKTINQKIQTDGYRGDPIPWDGKDDYGDRLARGVYIYKLRVQASDGSSAEKFEKLVILN